MRLDANKGNYRHWCVYHAEECRMLRRVVWVDDETSQWCQELAVVNGTLMTRINQARKIVIMAERCLVVINPIEYKNDNSIVNEVAVISTTTLG